MACDEYKSGLYYRGIRDWTNDSSITCFYFEAFDEPWKQAANPFDAENHFGLITVDGQIKYALWDAFDVLSSDSIKREDFPCVRPMAEIRLAYLNKFEYPIPEYHQANKLTSNCIYENNIFILIASRDALPCCKYLVVAMHSIWK